MSAEHAIALVSALIAAPVCVAMPCSTPGTGACDLAGAAFIVVMYLSYMVFFLVFNHVRTNRMKGQKAAATAAAATGKTTTATAAATATAATGKTTTATAAATATAVGGSVGFTPPCVRPVGAGADQDQADAFSGSKGTQAESRAGSGAAGTASKPSPYGLRERTPKKTK